MKGVCSILLSVLLILAVSSCAPVIRKDLMDVGIRDVPLSEVQKNPDSYKAKLFILGGIIADTKVTSEGSLIEAVYVPVDYLGYLKGNGGDGRYLALFPEEGGILDPMVYRPGKSITIAGEFAGIRRSKLDQREYSYPFFVIREIYLWEDRMYYYPYPYYYYPYPWWGYPYPFGWAHRPFWW